MAAHAGAVKSLEGWLTFAQAGALLGGYTKQGVNHMVFVSRAFDFETEVRKVGEGERPVYLLKVEAVRRKAKELLAAEEQAQLRRAEQQTVVALRGKRAELREAFTAARITKLADQFTFAGFHLKRGVTKWSDLSDSDINVVLKALKARTVAAA